jgi:hypothetical protein
MFNNEVVVKKDFTLIIDNDDLDNAPATDPGMKDELQRWPLFGLSVGSFLQVISMERQTCIMEVYLDSKRWGHFCLIQGELYDAVCGDLEAEKAALEMIAWENVRLNIKQILNTSGLVRKIDKNLMLLLMEGSRLRDEITADGDDAGLEEADGGETTEDVEDGIQYEKLSACLEIMAGDMGEALVAASISHIDESKIVASLHDAPESTAAVLRLTKFFRKSLTDTTAGGLGEYYILDLKDRQTLLVLIIEQYQWCVLFKNDKCTLGLLRNVIIPKTLKAFNEVNIV